jgi:hypothetical protein
LSAIMKARACASLMFEADRRHLAAAQVPAGEQPAVVMQAIASWTNLSETTFVCTPTDKRADYRLRNLHAAPRAAVRRPPDDRLGACRVTARPRAAGARPPPGARVWQGPRRSISTRL